MIPTRRADDSQILLRLLCGRMWIRAIPLQKSEPPSGRRHIIYIGAFQHAGIAAFARRIFRLMGEKNPGPRFLSRDGACQRRCSLTKYEKGAAQGRPFFTYIHVDQCFTASSGGAACGPDSRSPTTKPSDPAVTGTDTPSSTSPPRIISANGS